MISSPVLRKLAAQGAKVHCVTVTFKTSSRGWTNHFASKAQADRELTVHAHTWANCATTAYSTKPASLALEQALKDNDNAPWFVLC